MIKKICIMAVLFSVGAFAFAQAQPKAILSRSDVDNFVKNFDDIQEAMDEHEDELSSLTMDFSGMEGAKITAQIATIRGFAASAGLRAKLARFGLGNNAFEKCMVILYGMSVIYVEQMFGMMGGEIDKDMAAMIDAQIKPIKAAIHASDLSLVSARKDDLLPLLE